MTYERSDDIDREPLDPERDEWRWFEVKNELFIYAESRDDLKSIVKAIEGLGTRRFKTGQTTPCIELSVVEIVEEE